MVTTARWCCSGTGDDASTTVCNMHLANTIQVDEVKLFRVLAILASPLSVESATLYFATTAMNVVRRPVPDARLSNALCFQCALEGWQISKSYACFLKLFLQHSSKEWNPGDIDQTRRADLLVKNSEPYARLQCCILTAVVAGERRANNLHQGSGRCKKPVWLPPQRETSRVPV